MENESEILKERHKKIEFWRNRNIDPYGERFLPKDSIGDLIARFEEGKKARVAGRIMAVRLHGKSVFADLRDETGKLQLYTKLDDLGKDRFDEFCMLDVGDIVGTEGAVFKSRTGEITLKIESFRILSKILQVLPEKWHGLKDVEIRYRRRYLDLIVNQEVKSVFHLRSQIIKGIRSFLDERGFIEVETPMMQAIPGGARAKPFKTFHEALSVDLYLRVAPELYLKRLLVGGFEKVYEINRNFRNEGLSVRHNPEFTMLELYQSFGDLRDMIEITEEMITTLIGRVCGTETLLYGDWSIDFRRPWKKIGFYDALKDKTGMDWRCGDIRAEAKKLGLAVDAKTEEADVLNLLFDTYVEPDLVHPTFITDYPLCMSPLAKQKAGDNQVADRFELFIAKLEVANAFSELNDPIEQRKRLEEQRRMIGEHKELDEDFLLALQYGMPPAGGLGIGIDRLIMLLTHQRAIRDVLLFPQMRPEK
ncbi:MAG TPA: lysine--tRNA ligase [Candidatus Omnitrophota bacterium]|nr:lysine--tRNA ligase [Candidatus Omnitrophota bacterium]